MELRKLDVGTTVGANVFAEIGWEAIETGVFGATVVAKGLVREGVRGRVVAAMWGEWI